MANVSNATNITDETVKVAVGTQTYHCELGAELSCKAINEVQQKVIQLKTNGGQVGAEDKTRALTADVVTSRDGSNIVYDVTICSIESCSLSTTTSSSTGEINLVVSGQYNITKKSFDVLGFFISTNTLFFDLQSKVLRSTFRNIK